MQHAPMTEMDRAVWLMKAPLETENAYKDADRADASIMRRAQSSRRSSVEPQFTLVRTIRENA